MSSAPALDRLAFAAAARALLEPGRRLARVFDHGRLEVRFYAPRSGHDPQTPHTRDEVYVVVSGRGEFVCEGRRAGFGPGDLLFASAGAEHRFENVSEDFGTWAIFYGPEGGGRG